MSRIAPLALVAVFLSAPGFMQSADACTCAPGPAIEHVYAGASHVVRVNIRKEVRRVHRIRGVPTLDGTVRVYRARVRETYKGCLRRGRILKLVTAKDSGLCGATLDRRQEYVIALGEGDHNAFEINACDLIRPVDTLTPAEIEFLDTRYECCGRRCACTGSDPVSCLVDPCQLESCGEARCQANYCGGCNAEFFDPTGQPVCTACEGPFDCGLGQTCAGGSCVPDVACGLDEDCENDAWCRPTPATGSSCAPFVGEGESCGGFVPPWAFERCEPGLDCLVPPPPPGTPGYPDAPGICTTLDP